MPRFASELRLGAALAAGALVLVGCGTTSDPAAGEPAVQLPAEAATSAPTRDSAGGSGPSPTPSSQVDADEVIPVGTATVLDDTADLDVEDKAGQGRTVLIEEVSSGSGSGFVVVHEAGRTVLGSVPVTGSLRAVTGSLRAVSLKLDAPMLASQELLAVLFRDDGDGTFDPATDAIVIEEGEPVAEEFDYLLQ
ncbi:MAG: hypothetical protein WCF36_15995 [Candidatus Nanopelagicales bacterium]